MYGVRLVGWPEGVPSQNPSSLKSGQNKLLLDALQKGTMRFQRLSHVPSIVESEGTKGPADITADEATEDFSWAYDADAGPSSPIQERTVKIAKSIPACSSIVFIEDDASSGLLDEPGENHQETWNLEDHIIGNNAHYTTGYTWGDEFHDSSESVDVWGGAEEEHLVEPERPRKRLRSEEPRTNVVGEL